MTLLSLPCFKSTITAVIIYRKWPRSWADADRGFLYSSACYLISRLGTKFQPRARVYRLKSAILSQAGNTVCLTSTTAGMVGRDTSPSSQHTTQAVALGVTNLLLTGSMLISMLLLLLLAPQGRHSWLA